MEWNCLGIRSDPQEALVSHANAALTPRARLRVAQLVVDQRVPISEVAARFQCSWPTVARRARRYAAGEPMSDRTSRPHSMPAKTDTATTRRIVSLRLRKRLGPVQLAAATGVAPATAHRVLVRCGLNRLSHVDRATGEPVRRYEHDHPGAMLHVDVKKFGNIPDGGGWRFVGRAQGMRNRAATPNKPKNRHSNPKMGHAFVHSVIDDHSRIAYAKKAARRARSDRAARRRTGGRRGAPAAEVLRITRAAGLIDNVVKKARRKAGVRTKRVGFGKDSSWIWSLNDAGDARPSAKGGDEE